MLYWFMFNCLLVIVNTLPYDDNEIDGECSVSYCVGEAYQCIDGQCYCAPGYIANYFQTRCVKCPGLGENCFGQCCNQYENGSLYCWQGTCQACHDKYGNWICRDTVDQVFLISTSQVIMASALILGIIATFVLLYKLCAVTGLRTLGRNSNIGSRLSIGSLQMYVEERLRDAPPRYSRNPPAGTLPAGVFLNAGFVHDSSIPPPPYTPPEVKNEDNQITTMHM